MSTPITITDAKGRKLSIKPLDAVGQFDLFEACGTNSSNDRYLGMAALACSIVAIDDAPVPFPRTHAQIRSLIQRAGSEGINAAADALQPPAPPDGATEDAGNDLAVAKN